MLLVYIFLEKYETLSHISCQTLSKVSLTRSFFLGKK